MKNIWKKHKEFIVVLGYAILFACLFKFVIFFLQDSINEKRRYAQEQLINKDVSEKRIGEMPSIKSKIDSIKPSEAKLNVFAEAGNALPLIENIESIAEKTGNSIEMEVLEDTSRKKEDSKKPTNKEDVTIKSNLPGEDYLGIRINLSGDFNTIRAFIEKLESSSYFSDIVSIKMTKPEEDPLSAIAISATQTSFMQSGVIIKTESNQESKSVKKFENPLEAVLEVVFYSEKKQ